MCIIDRIKYGITCYKEQWYLGELVENDHIWKAHKYKPHAYSSALDSNIAKVLINLASQGDKTKRLIDPCCGVGTVLLEGLFAGYDIKGCEINSKVAEASRLNVIHYGYETEVINGDIKDIKGDYDAAIVDLPYGNFSEFNVEKRLEIIRQAMRISKRLILVSSKDIGDKLLEENLNILDCCKVYKTEKRDFVRYIWICEQNGHHHE
jgi:tRNA G10  N-methylase Trm11